MTKPIESRQQPPAVADPRRACPPEAEIAPLLDAWNRGDMHGVVAQAEALAPRYAGCAPLFNQLGLACARLERHAAAGHAFARVAEIDPENVAALANLGVALNSQQRFAEAEAVLRRALDRDPGRGDCWQNLGVALDRQERFDEAADGYRRVIALDPARFAAQFNLALALIRLGHFAEADAAFARALAIQPRHVDAHWNRSMVRLALGDLEAGFALYEWREHKPDVVVPRSFDAPRWTGVEDIAGKTILVHAEQGLGDTIQFFRYAALLRERGARVIMAVQPVLVPLLTGALDGVEIIALDKDPFPACDYHIRLMGLPHACRTRLDTVPPPAASIRVAPERLARWAGRLGGSELRIGVCWNGSIRQHTDTRAFPLSVLAPIAAMPGVRLISLHKGLGEDQLASLPEGMQVEVPSEDFDPPGEAFLDSAAIMRCCDLVISSDTAIAHLAGTLGVPTWLMLRHAADWRWLIGREDSPWYPGMRLFRQDDHGDWPSAVAKVERALGELMEARAARGAATRLPQVPVSWGEVIDKITILEIKQERIADAAARQNVARELAELQAVTARGLDLAGPLAALRDALRDINTRLWDIEDDIRDCERRQDFSEDFVRLARAVYHSNDERARLKRAINAQTGSALVEEKSYEAY